MLASVRYILESLPISETEAVDFAIAHNGSPCCNSVNKGNGSRASIPEFHNLLARTKSALPGDVGACMAMDARSEKRGFIVVE